MTRTWMKALGFSVLLTAFLIGCSSEETSEQSSGEAGSEQTPQQELQNPVDEEKKESSEAFIDYMYNGGPEEDVQSFVEEYVHSDAAEFLGFMMLGSSEESERTGMEATQQTTIEDEGQAIDVVQVEAANEEGSSKTHYVMYEDNQIAMFPLVREDIMNYDAKEATEDSDSFFSEEDIEGLQMFIEQIENQLQ
ncbi:hypothetical protein SAMN05192534_12819 [Alteribacillus persepolensis]|uniref:Sporulation lipoprotein YhcN/YlaJ (Spore_YhcN_YlaJ) n=1 Tax=Alteribacillus persepolensis TaxID=568899 RepID=A0A1G8J2N1_9BACI|nr:hypothetical protein [Alteribacillus persepolensis]SDI25217.1 hypothetical protein SAMN05192534_12819 [Alteribacillus persepolensis]